MTNALPSSQTPAPADGASAQDRLKTPALLTRRYDRKDGSHGHEVWCHWCEKTHSHGEDAGHRAAHCADYDGRSRLAATGYDMAVVAHAHASDAPSRFPAGRGFVGKRRFWRALVLSAGEMRRALIGALLAKTCVRSDLAVLKIPDKPGEPGMWVEVGEFGDRLGWSIVYSDGEAFYGDDLASLISELFALPPGVAFVRVAEAALGIELDARAALAIAAEVDAWRDRGAPKNEGRCA